MSLRAAEILAGRLGVNVAQLMSAAAPRGEREADLQLLRAEQLLASGEPGEATTLLGSIERGLQGSHRARAQHLRARALLAADQPRAAIDLLDQALRAYRTQGQHDSLARVLYDLATAHARLDQLGEALNLALQCERFLQSGELVDRQLELRVMSLIAALEVGLGDYSSADLRAQRAAAIAEDVADPRALATLYGSLALTRQEQGDLESALLYTRKSLELYERLQDERAIADVWNTLAWIYLRRRQFSRAEQALDRAEGFAKAQGRASLRAWVGGTRAELAVERGSFKEAVRLADASVATAAAGSRARAESLLIRAIAIARARRPVPEIRKAFDRALDAAKKQPRRLQAKAHRAYADALAARDQPKDAFAHAQRALTLLQPSL